MIGERLTRERQKYADYDTLKEKAGKYDEAQEANKTELQKALDNAAKAQKELDALKSANTVRDIRDKVAKEMEIPASLLTADTYKAKKWRWTSCTCYPSPLLCIIASPGGFEPLTPRLGGECSIQLSYEDTCNLHLYSILFYPFSFKRIFLSRSS